MGGHRDIPDSFEKGDEEVADHADQRENVSSFDQELAITSIRATDVAIGLTRIPAGFYIAVKHSYREWRTPSKPVSVKDDTIEWDGPIPIPSNPSATVHIEVYAPFELSPVLGQGERLWTLSVTKTQLLHHGGNGLPFSDPAYSCLSLLATVGHSSPTLSVVPYRSVTDQMDPSEEATNQGHRAFSRYQKNGAMPDLERSIEAFRRALDNCSSESPRCAAAQSNLAMAKLASCQVDNSNISFDDPIQLYRDALDARRDDHPDRSSTLINLAAAYLSRFERLQDALDAEHAEALLCEAKDTNAADSHEKQVVTFARLRLAERTTGLVRVGSSLPTQSVSASRSAGNTTPSVEVSLLRSFEYSGDLAVLEEVISALESISALDRDPASLGNLGVALWYRFTRLGQLDDLDQAIEMQRDAIESTPDGPGKAARLNNLGISLLIRFRRLGNPVDLTEAIARHKDAIDRLDNHPDKPRHLNNLGNCFLARFERLGKRNDLEQAIAMHKNASECIADDHPDKPNHLNNLATSFRTRFRHLHELRDLYKAVWYNRRAVELAPDEDPHKSAYLSNLATSILTRFMQSGELSDFKRAISVHQWALQLTTDTHPDKPRRLNNLANYFLARFECLCHPNDIKEAISGHKEAVKLTPDDHPDRPRHINNLANSFRTRFQWQGESNDLERAISEHRNALELAGQNADSHVYLHGLATSLFTRFKHLGNSRDLEEAILGYNKATELTPNGHRRRPAYLNDLGMALLTRFEWLGNLDDLNDGISWLKEAVALTADGLLEKIHFLRNLGVCLRTRFTHAGDPEDLGQAISRHREAVPRVSDGSMDNLNCWNYRASITTTDTRFGHRRSEQSDLDQAILSYEGAVQLTSDHNPNKRRHLFNLANCFLARFEQLGRVVDLDEATKLHGDAVEPKNSLSSSRARFPCDPSLSEGCKDLSADVHCH